MNYIICHYSEIGIKGKNRNFFEKTLEENIKNALVKNNIDFEKVKRISGRIIVKLNSEKLNEEKKKIEEILKNIPGIANFSYAVSVNADIEDIKKKALMVLSEVNFSKFRISTTRSDKNFPLKSYEVNEIVGEYILKNLKDKKVDLKNFDVECFIEIVSIPDTSFIYTKKIKGIGGLPVKTQGKVVSLISGGIDSPVASFYAMKRGCEVVFLHFHSFPYTDRMSIEKVKKIVKILNKFQNKSKIYLVPFAEIQEEILSKTFKKEHDKLRVIIYRRFMLRIAEKICEKENALAIVTGESLGQVASQTLNNLRVIENVTKIPILRPLITFDKEEIINNAINLNTYEISIIPHQDCCIRFLPKNPATKAKIKDVEEFEKTLNFDLINKAIEKAEILEIE